MGGIGLVYSILVLFYPSTETLTENSMEPVAHDPDPRGDYRGGGGHREG